MKRIVVKVGSAVLSEQNRIAKDRMQRLVDFIAELKKTYEVILVSSGAVAAGYTELKLDKKILANKQALASIGQPILMYKYRNLQMLVAYLIKKLNRIFVNVLLNTKPKQLKTGKQESILRAPMVICQKCQPAMVTKCFFMLTKDTRRKMSQSLLKKSIQK